MDIVNKNGIRIV